MADTQFEIERLRIAAEVKKVVYGTFLLGVAVALFPVISGYIQHDYNLRIEKEKQVNALALQANQLALDLRKIERENALAMEAARASTEQSDRTFFESIADEARSANLSDRITIAEFFAFVARDDAERQRWKDFLQHLVELQANNNEARKQLLLTLSDVQKSEAERAAAARALGQIDERESGVAPPGARNTWLEMIPIPPLTGDQPALSAVRSTAMLAMLGSPTAAPRADCAPPDNPLLISLLEEENFGAFKATLLRPAAQSLKRIMTAVEQDHPDLFKEIGSAGSLCVRLVRGSQTKLSNHSWGTAIDLTLGGVLARRGDVKAARGLVTLSTYFEKEGWFWGGRFASAEAYHFEVSAETLDAWQRNGLLRTPEAGDRPSPSVELHEERQ